MKFTLLTVRTNYPTALAPILSPRCTSNSTLSTSNYCATVFAARSCTEDITVSWNFKPNISSHISSANSATLSALWEIGFMNDKAIALLCLNCLSVNYMPKSWWLSFFNVAPSHMNWEKRFLWPSSQCSVTAFKKRSQKHCVQR